MKIAVFGATGNVGRLFIEKALSAGHEIVAYARRPKKVALRDGVSVVAGELTNAAQIEKAIQGTDAVVSVMGPLGRQNSLIFAPAYESIISAMKKHGVSRLIALGTPSIPSSLDRPSLVFGALIVVVGMLIHKGYEDIQRVGELIRESGLEWTLVRVPLLTNRPARGKITIGHFGNGVWWPRLSRADFADFILKQLTDKTYVGKAPAISN